MARTLTMIVTRLALIVLLSLVGVASTTSARSPKSGEDVIAAMRKKYDNKWYKTTTFRQVTTNIDSEGKKRVSIWYEAIAMPGRLRIDIEPVKDGNGILFANDHIYQIKAGKVDRSQPLVHPLLLLGFDVYFLAVEETVAKLKGLKVDLSIVREDKWQGRSVYVVGAKAGDLKSAQFWIDKDRLYFLRMIQPAGKDGSRTSETQFNKYVRLGGGWIAPEVIFLLDGKVTTTEEYSQMLADVRLDDSVFDPEKWKDAKLWGQ